MNRDAMDTALVCAALLFAVGLTLKLLPIAWRFLLARIAELARAWRGQ